MMPKNEGEENVTLHDLLKEIKDTKNEVKNCISDTEIRLLLEIKTLKNKYEALERENENLKDRLERTEQWCNKNNIVIFGIHKSSVITADFICEEIGKLLDVEIDRKDINDCYKLGKEENSPIKVEFISHQCKKSIFRNIKKLKGTEISIANDLTLRQRQDFRKLKSFLRTARLESSEISYVKGNKLIIGKESFTLEELEKLNRKVTNSTPNTPTTNYNSEKSKETEQNTSTTEGKAAGSNIQGKNIKDKKTNNTPHLPTHKKIFSNKTKSPPKTKNDGMKLREKPTSEKKN